MAVFPGMHNRYIDGVETAEAKNRSSINGKGERLVPYPQHCDRLLGLPRPPVQLVRGILPPEVSVQSVKLITHPSNTMVKKYANHYLHFIYVAILWCLIN